MAKMKAAMIGFLPGGQDPYETLAEYAKIGYSAFEGADLLLKGDAAENRKRVEDMGLKPLAVHFDTENHPAIGEIVRRAKAAGVSRAACYMGCAGAYRFNCRPDKPGYDEVMRELEMYETSAKALAEEGITLSFHNHDAELRQTLRGVPLLYLMAANTEYLKFEADVGWVLYGGEDPVAVLKALGSRLAALHIKDFAEGDVTVNERDGRVNIMPNFTTPGTGLLPLKECLETACGLGLDYAIVEQDFQRNLTQKETLTAAYLNMKETGFVE